MLGDGVDTVAVRRAERSAGVVSMAAGLVHGGLTPSHFAEWWGYGLFFLGAALAQVLWGLAVLTNAINPADTGPHWRRWKRVLYGAGLAGNLALLLMYVVSRTVGVPFAGPDRGEVEPVGALDVVTKILEVVVIGICAGLLWFVGRGVEPSPRGHA